MKVLVDSTKDFIIIVANFVFGVFIPVQTKQQIEEEKTNEKTCDYVELKTNQVYEFNLQYFDENGIDIYFYLCLSEICASPIVKYSQAYEAHQSLVQKINVIQENKEEKKLNSILRKALKYEPLVTPEIKIETKSTVRSLSCSSSSPSCSPSSSMSSLTAM